MLWVRVPLLVTPISFDNLLDTLSVNHNLTMKLIEKMDTL
jgi:hypothetical protein